MDAEQWVCEFGYRVVCPHCGTIQEWRVFGCPILECDDCEFVMWIDFRRCLVLSLPDMTAGWLDWSIS